MKIMHTADWHLGLITEGLSRKDEQQRVLGEICEIADKKEIDIVLICGDLFCGVNTPAYADEFLANTLLRLSAGGKRAVVVIAGNNDATERFTATKQFGIASNIFLLNDLGTDFDEENLPQKYIRVCDKGRGFIIFEKGSEKVCVAFMPYPSNFFQNEKTKENETLHQKTKRLFELAAGGFKPECFNIAAAHMFVPHGANTQDYYTEFFTECLPKNAQYVALGHVHDLIEVNEKTVYPGSTIQVYDKENTSKYVVVLDIERNRLKAKEFVRLREPKKLVTVTGETSKELMKKLSGFENCLVKVQIKQEKISADEITDIKKAFPFIYSFVLIPKTKKSKLNITGKDLSEEQLLSKFYETVYAKKPGGKIEKLFLEILKEGNKNEAE